MAGAGYGVTPMSRLSQHSSRRRSHTGKSSDLSSPNTLSKKKTPKRKTLSSRYTAVLPSKRRKLGLDAIRDPVNLLGESHQAPEVHHVAVSPKACNASEVSSKNKEARPSSTRGRVWKAKAKAKARARVNARVKVSRCLKVETCPIAKLLDAKENSNEEAHASSAVDLNPDLFALNASTEVRSISDGNHNGASTPSLLESVNLKVGSQSLETNEAGALLSTINIDLESTYAASRQSTERHIQVSKRGPGRKSSKQFSTQNSGSWIRAAKNHEAFQANIENEPSTLVGCGVQDSSIQGVVDSSSLIRQDPSLLEGSFLRPRRKAKTKSKFEEHRLPPWDYVGKRVVVYWPHAKAWYAGKVIMYDDTSKKHKIKYDDSDEECISFRRHKVILEKPLSTQSADSQMSDKGVLCAQRVQFPAEVVAPHKAALGDHVEDGYIVEDNALLSAFARHRAREGFYETLCNGSVVLTNAVKGHDATPSNNTTVHKLFSKKSMSSAAQEHTGRPVGDKGSGGGKEAFVYVRRTKSRRKVDVSPTDMALDGRIDEQNVVSAALQQKTSRKRRIPRSCLQQMVQVEFPDCKFYGNESSFSDAPDICGTNGDDTNALEHASRKRNKRSLKKLVSQASNMVAKEIAEEAEPQQGQMRKQRTRRTRRKLARKHKMNNGAFSARNRRLSTKRVLCLADGVQGLAFEGSASTVCRDVAKLKDFEVPGHDMLVHESFSLFFSTIHLVLPIVIPDLFTWQLFSILRHTHFCDGGSFDEIFCLNGSMSDWMGIFRILLRIIKAMPLSAYMNGRQWQCIILHEFWNFMPRCGPDALASLTPEVERLVGEHLLGASVSCRMTSREILNLFVCYFIKPFVLTTICEKGISIQVVVQQFLLLVKRKDGGTTCLRQSVKHFPMQSSLGNADKSFSSYLMLLPRSTDWCTEGGLFVRQMEEWIRRTGHAGYAETWIPIPGIKKLDYLGWQVTSTHLVSGGYAMDELENKMFILEEENSKSGSLNDFHLNCLRHAEVINHPFDQIYGWSSGPCNGHCLNSAFLLTSFLQKRLNEAVRKCLGSAQGSCHPLAVSLSLGKVSTTDALSFTFDQTKLIGGLSVPEDASKIKRFAAFSNFVTRKDLTAYSCFCKSASQVVNAPTKHIKVEPDISYSRRNSSITTESNSAAVKEESSVETNGRQQRLSSIFSKPDLAGQTNEGHRLKADEQHFSGQIDQEYYDNKFFKDVKMVKKSRPRYRTERHRPLFKERPTYYCIADLLFLSNDNVERELGAKVELHLRADSSFLIAVHVDGKSFEQKIVEGGMLAKNPLELTWKSENGWALQFPEREQWELFRCIYNELCLQAMRTTCVKEIPVPVVKEVEISDVGDCQRKSFLRPFFAIKSPGEEIEAAFRTGRILYDLDSEDEAWMGETNMVSIVSGSESISHDTLEQIIDRLEKEAYRRGEATVTVHDAIECCQGLAVADIVRAVHTYWSSKRLVKGKSLLRYCQPPLWEQYQDELQAWENKMQEYSPDAQNMLLDRYPRPIMSAFCLQSRCLDSLDTSKRMLRQRSQRKIRPTSRSSSEDSHRLPVYRYVDSTPYLIHHSEDARPSPHSTIGPYQHFDHGQDDEEILEDAKIARARAVEARRVAETRALKLQRRFLEFDLSLQRAWALLIESAVAGGDASDKSEAFEGTMTRLFTRCSSLLRRGDDSSEDEPPSHSGQLCRDVGDEFIEAFAKKCSLNGNFVLCNSQDKAGDNDIEEASPLLPVFVKGSSYAWNGSSLL